MEPDTIGFRQMYWPAWLLMEEPPKAEPPKPLVAVLFHNGIYKMLEGKVYRFDLGPYPNKRHHFTGFKSLEDILETREGAEPIYPGDTINIKF